MPAPAPTSIEALVVDDDDFVRSVLSGQLKAAGAASVLTAANWPAARDLLDRSPACNLVVSDLDMPGAAGTSFLEELAVTRPGIAVIIISALDRVVLAATEKQLRKLQLRLLGVIAKPASLDVLRTLLGSLNVG